ncbi:sensor histidine kinase [Streptosporangium lutulentum]
MELARATGGGADSLTLLREQARQTLNDLRELAAGIHPSVLSQGGLVEAVEERCSGLPVATKVAADPALRARRFPDEVEGALYFTVSEAIANALKHASASRIEVRLTQSTGRARRRRPGRRKGLRPGRDRPPGTGRAGRPDDRPRRRAGRVGRTRRGHAGARLGARARLNGRGPSGRRERRTRGGDRPGTADAPSGDSDGRPGTAGAPCGDLRWPQGDGGRPDGGQPKTAAADGDDHGVAVVQRPGPGDEVDELVAVHAPGLGEAARGPPGQARRGVRRGTRRR